MRSRIAERAALAAALCAGVVARPVGNFRSNAEFYYRVPVAPRPAEPYRGVTPNDPGFRPGAGAALELKCVSSDLCSAEE